MNPEGQKPQPKPRSIDGVRPGIAPPSVPILPATPRPQQPTPIAKRPLGTDTKLTTPSQPVAPATASEPDVTKLQPLDDEKPDTVTKKPRRWLKITLGIIGTVLLLAAIAVATAIWWYTRQLTPLSATEKSPEYINVEQGATVNSVADTLESKQLIRNSTAFVIYMKLSHGTVKAGRYSLSAHQSVQDIATHLASGKQDQIVVTFLPGDTLAGHRKALIKAGFDEAAVDAALKKTYTGDLFAGKPAAADLEGYIYGETYQFDVGTTPEVALQHVFDYFDEQLTKNNLLAGFKAQGLTTYQAITLASIVQREVGGDQSGAATEDQAMVAGVFYNRMKDGMTLGSDVTFQYAAKKLGVEATPTLDSPYNTRIHTGLPPGPIASPGLGALKAVAQPKANDYLFFISGDDDKTYFAKTVQQHEENVRLHCTVKCAL